MSSRLPGLKLLAFENARPPRCSQTCIGEQTVRLKTAVPSMEHRSCCDADTETSVCVALSRFRPIPMGPRSAAHPVRRAG
jgi:hypothetical protein